MANQSNHAARALPPPPRLLVHGAATARLLRALEEQGFEHSSEHAGDWSGFRVAAARASFDVIIADHTDIDLAATLRSLRASGVRAPLILVTKRLPQEVAIAAIKAGAHDCVRRDDPARLAAAIEAAVAEQTPAQRPSPPTIFAESRYRDLVENIHDVLFAIDADGRITFINSAIESQSGYRREELLGKPYLSLVHPDDVADLLASLDRSLSGEVLPAEWRAIDKDGRVRWVRSFSRAVFAGERLIEIRGVLTDIAERRRVEEQLRRTLEEKAELYRARSQEAEIGAALTAVAQELIPSLDTPNILDRLCRASSEALACDYAHTFLLEEDFYVPVAGHGDSPELWQSMRLIRIPRHRLEQGESSAGGGVLLEGIRGRAVSPWLPAHAVGAGLFVPLHRGSELVGCLTAGRRADSFAANAARVAGGIAQLASLALQNARLVEDFERADHSRADFVANLSHELRTPLNVIIGYSDLLLDGAFGAVVNEQRDAMRRVGEQARELIDLVNTTLDLSRIEAGRVPLDIEDVHLAEVLDEIECETRVTFADRDGVAFSWRVEENLPALATDAVKLKVVIKNLVTNAMKFTVAGSVRVSAARRRDGCEIAVVDTGPGIARDQQNLIFEAFRQVDVGRGAQKGVGLGLHIVQRLLVILGGTIRVDSEPGRGAAFRVWLPVAAPRPGTPRRANT